MCRQHDIVWRAASIFSITQPRDRVLLCGGRPPSQCQGWESRAADPIPPRATPEEQCDTHRHCIHFCDLAGHPGDDEYDNCARGNENIHKMLWTVSRMWRGVLAMAVGVLPFDGPESGQQSLGDTMPKHRHTLKRVLALLGPRGLACLFGSRRRRGR